MNKSKNAQTTKKQKCKQRRVNLFEWILKNGICLFPDRHSFNTNRVILWSCTFCRKINFYIHIHQIYDCCLLACLPALADVVYVYFIHSYIRTDVCLSTNVVYILSVCFEMSFQINALVSKLPLAILLKKYYL